MLTSLAYLFLLGLLLGAVSRKLRLPPLGALLIDATHQKLLEK